MPADISFVNGKAEDAFALKAAWWDTANEYTSSSDGGRNDQGAHLDGEVQPQPIYNFDGQMLEGYNATVRNDKGAHLDVVSD